MKTWAVLAKVLFEDPPDVRELRPDIPEALAELVDRMLLKEAEGRPKDGAEVRDILDTLVDPSRSIVQRPTLRRPTSESRRAAEDPARRSPGGEQRLVSVVVAVDHADVGSVMIDPGSNPAARSPTRSSFSRFVGPPPTAEPPRTNRPVLQLASASDDDEMETKVEARPPDIMVRLAAALAPLGGRLEELADGSLVTILSGGGTRRTRWPRRPAAPW